MVEDKKFKEKLQVLVREKEDKEKKEKERRKKEKKERENKINWGIHKKNRVVLGKLKQYKSPPTTKEKRSQNIYHIETANICFDKLPHEKQFLYQPSTSQRKNNFQAHFDLTYSLIVDVIVSVVLG